MASIIPPRRFIFSGGGIRICAHFGAYKILKPYLSHVREWTGVSAGALLALMIVLEYTVEEMEEMCIAYDFSSIRSLDPDYYFNFFDNLGIDPGENLTAFIEILLEKKGLSSNTTFGQLNDSMSIFRCWATNILTLEPIEFSQIKTPEVPIVIALRASMSLPFYFSPVNWQDKILVDGACLGNFPIIHLTEKEANESWGLTFDDHTSKVDKIYDFWTFLGQVINSGSCIKNKELYKKHLERLIIIPCAEFPSWNFEATVEEKRRLMVIGEDAARNFLESNRTNNSMPVRRWSVG